MYITYFCSTSTEYFNWLAQRLTHDTEGERSDKRLPTRNRRIKMVNTTYQWQLDRKKILAMDGTDTTARNTSASTLFRKLVDTCLWNKLRCRLKWEDKKRRREKRARILPRLVVRNSKHPRTLLVSLGPRASSPLQPGNYFPTV